MVSLLLDLDAARREAAHPDGMAAVFGGEEFVFPSELPMRALMPLLGPELDLVGSITRALSSSKGIPDGLLEMLLLRPDLPHGALNAFLDIYRDLLGDEQYERFAAKSPSVPDYARLTRALASAYGASLGKLFGLSSSAEAVGTTSSPTSQPTPAAPSTPEESGSGQDSPVSSASAA